MANRKDHAVILFDGVCNFCNSSVRFVIKRDPQKRFQFASLQSTYAQNLLREKIDHPEQVDSIVLVQNGEAHTKSTAALKIARQLGGLWPLFSSFLIIPRFIRDAVYDFIARNRYQWFGKKEACPMPPPGIQDRFISTET